MSVQIGTENKENGLSIIWIDKNINSKENRYYLTQLGYDFKSNYLQNDNQRNASFSNYPINTINKINKSNPYIHPFERIDEAIKYIKRIRFDSTFIIVSGSGFANFVKEFHKNINDIYVIPKIIVFTANKKTLELPKEIQKENLDIFYKYGGIKTDFNEIKQFIEKKQEEILNYPRRNLTPHDRSYEVKLIFEQVTQIEELILPSLFDKTVLKKPDHESNNRFNEELCSKYINQADYKSLLKQIINVKNIPIELLCKYYARIYTINGDFFGDMKRDLLEANEENFKKYEAFIKTLFEGRERNALKSFIREELYSAQKIPDEEIKKYQKFIGKEIKGCPSSLLFSKVFISFSKDKNKAEQFFKDYKNNVMLTLEKYDNTININTHADIENISMYPGEREVLFFPFSSFGIEQIEQDPVNPERYDLRMKYLGKYIQDFIKDKNFIKMEKILPKTKFQANFEKSCLGKEEKTNTFKEMKIKDVINDYETYKSSKTKCSRKWWFLALIPLLGLIGLIKLKFSDSKEKCKKNYYYDKSNSKCLTCSSGYFSNGNTEYCSRCPYGQTSNGNGGDCYNCSAGTITNYFYKNCEECGAGYYSEEGSSSCKECPEGTYSNISGAPSCNNCPAGMTSDYYRTSCQNCSAGYYSFPGSGGCIKCPGGTYSDKEESSKCNICPAGTYSNSYGTACVNCSIGYYANTSGSAECIKCPEGTYNTEEGSISCTLCPVGTYEYYRESCKNCSIGYYSNKTGATGCNECPAGTYNTQPGSANCSICPAGTYEYYRESCKNCPIGYYSNKTGATGCNECPAGTYNTQPGSTNCSICPAGTYEYYRESCKNCPIGYYSNKTGATGCNECPAGTYNTQPGSTNCSICPAGTYEYYRESCKNCPSGYCSDPGSTSCHECP